MTVSLLLYGMSMCLIKTNLFLGAIRMLKQLRLRQFGSSPISHLANRSPRASLLVHLVSCAAACVCMSCNLHVYANTPTYTSLRAVSLSELNSSQTNYMLLPFVVSVYVLMFILTVSAGLLGILTPFLRVPLNCLCFTSCSSNLCSA